MRLRAVKSTSQRIPTNQDLESMMEIFRKIVNQCIRIGLKHNKTSRINLTYLCYPQLQD